MKQENFLATGMFYHLSEFEKLGTPNPFYEYTKKQLIDADMINERVYEYDYTCKNITLEPEPTNLHDPNAIKVIVNGHHVAYIKKGSTARIRNISKAGIVSITGDAGGGKYKCVYEDDGKYKTENGDADYFLRLTIIYNEENQTLSQVPQQAYQTVERAVKQVNQPSTLYKQQETPYPTFKPQPYHSLKQRHPQINNRLLIALLCAPAIIFGIIAFAVIILKSSH